MAWKVVTVSHKDGHGKTWGLSLEKFGPALEEALQVLDADGYKVEKIKVHNDGVQLNYFLAHIVAYNDNL